MKREVKNVAASTRQRLLNLARESGEEFERVLIRFGLERFLARLAQSRHADELVLKGAFLQFAWTGQARRPTRDVDFLGFGKNDPEAVKAMVRDICTTACDEDGLVFQIDAIQTEVIREGREYEGIRSRFFADLDGARIPIQVDVGFGDAVHPGIQEVEFPTLLGAPIRVRGYPWESIVSEKTQILVEFAMANSRLKDFFDLDGIAATLPFRGAELAEAMRLTFERRKTELPVAVPLALTSEFTDDPDKKTQWRAFLDRNGLPNDLELVDVARRVEDLVMPPLLAAGAGRAFSDSWEPGGPWRA